MAQKGSNGTTAMGMETNPIYHANDSKYITHLDASIPLYSWRSRSSTFKTKWLYNNVFHQPKAKNKYTWRRWCWTSRFEERPICPPKNHRKKIPPATRAAPEAWKQDSRKNKCPPGRNQRSSLAANSRHSCHGWNTWTSKYRNAHRPSFMDVSVYSRKFAFIYIYK